MSEMQHINITVVKNKDKTTTTATNGSCSYVLACIKGGTISEVRKAEPVFHIPL